MCIRDSLIAFGQQEVRYQLFPFKDFYFNRSYTLYQEDNPIMFQGLSLIHILFILSILVASIPIYVFMKRSVANTLHPDAKTFAGVKNGFALTSLFLQLTVGTLLIFCSLVFLYQFNKLNEKDIGFNRFNIMSFRCDVYLTKDELRKIPGVEEVIFFQYQFLPRGGTSHFRYKTESGEVIETESFQIHEPDFIEFFDMKILEGRNFHYGETNACLINETAKRKFGLNDPIGERVNNLTVIGVVADMYIDSPLLPRCV